MGLYNLDKIFSPDSIAIIGASEKKGTIGEALMRNLGEGGTSAELFPVNPNYSEIRGVKSYGSITDVEKRIDLAVIATPIQTVPDIVKGDRKSTRLNSSHYS